MESMAKNQVWDIAELSYEYTIVGCIWVHNTKNKKKIKKNTFGTIEQSKARLVANNFSQKELID